MQRKLDAEVVQPAEAQRKASEEKARGAAARIVEQGKAQAGALHALIEQYKRSGENARAVLVMQKLLPLANLIAGAQQKVTVQKLTVLPNGDGAAQGTGDFARKAIGMNEQLRAATGIDLGQVARRLAPPAPPPPPKTDD